MLTEASYNSYLEALLRGNSSRCLDIASRLLTTGMQPPAIYTELLQRSLYQVGELWEHNRISVATEHLATAISERILAIVYPVLLSGTNLHGRKAILSCTVNEYHQIGARMVADIMESRGWDVSFLGANTPIDDLLTLVDEHPPEFLGVSVSLYCNMGALHRLIDRVRVNYPGLDILVGGQAFRWGGTSIGKRHPQVVYIPSLLELDGFIAADRDA